MMHEDEFKNIHDVYRTLRKEGKFFTLLLISGVRFPERDPNNKYMISFKGQISPIFLAMESNFIAPANNQGGVPLDPNKRHNMPVVTNTKHSL
jgi:hypothetical protein